MGVPSPKSGDPITKTSVTDMYDAVAAVINAQGEDTFARGTFGQQHVPSIVLEADFKDVTNAEVVTASPFGAGTPLPNFDENDFSLWQVLNEYTMDNGGASYTLTPGILVMFCSIRWSEAADATTATHFSAQELWFNFNYTINGIDYEQGLNSRMLRNQIEPARATDTDGDGVSDATENVFGTDPLNPAVFPAGAEDVPINPARIVEETVTWWRVLDLTALSPNYTFKMGVKAVTQRSIGGDTQDCTLPNGFIGFVNLYGGF